MQKLSFNRVHEPKREEIIMISAKIREKSIGMKRNMSLWPLFLATAVALLLGVAAPEAWADDDKGELTLSALKFFIEFNETDEDIGVQVFVDGEPYERLKAFDPDERKILDIRPKRSLRMQGLTELFFESSEPPLAEFSVDEFLARFPEGEYEFETTTLDGIEQDGETMFTHVIPAGPVITFPLEGDVVDPDDAVIRWEPVTLTTAFNPPQVPVTIISYQVTVTRQDPLREYSVFLRPEATSVTVPPEFLDPGTEYELEVLAIEESDNQTFRALFFETAQ